jgi:hypothetical protein
MSYPHAMALRACRVTIQDMNGLRHTVDVAASSLFEAVAIGLTTLHDSCRVLPNGFAPVRVCVVELSVEYQVKLKDFIRWVNRLGNNPREVGDRKRIRRILGLSSSATL